MSNKVKMHPELSPNNQNNNGDGGEKTKLSWSERHPKITAFVKSLPGKALSVSKKILEGVIIVGGGIVLGVIGINAARPRKYGEFQLQLPERKTPLLPPVTETETSTVMEADKTFWDAAKADPNVEVTEF